MKTNNVKNISEIYWSNKYKFCNRCYEDGKLVEVNPNTDNGYYTPGDVDEEWPIKLCDECIQSMGHRICQKTKNEYSKYIENKEINNNEDNIKEQKKLEEDEIIKKEYKYEQKVDDTNELEEVIEGEIIEEIEWLK